MSLKLKLARFAAKIEVGFERLFGRDRVVQVIEPYLGYATPEHFVVRGRLLAATPKEVTAAGQSKLANARQMFRLFATREVANVPVSAGDVAGVSDDEGYFTILVPRDARTGEVEITVTSGEVQAICSVIVPGADARCAVISDIDDTMMETGAYSLSRNLWTSLTGNAQTRHVFDDAKELMQVLHKGGTNPVYFVSSSPWNFHGFLTDVFARNDLPRAPKFLRDYGISETQFITGTHGDHKGSAIDVLMAANPDLPYILVGDAGQHDAHVYADAVKRHPGRVTHVVLRSVGGGLDAQDKLHIETLRTLQVPVTVGPDYREAIAQLAGV